MRYTIDVYEPPSSLSKSLNIQRAMRIALEYIHTNISNTFSESNISVAIEFVSQRRSQQLKSMFLGIDQPTNVLSFPSGELSNIGDIAICWPIIEKEAIQQRISKSQHCVHMLLHGLLHLIGMDHINEQDRIKMENLESLLMLHLGYPDPWQLENLDN